MQSSVVVLFLLHVMAAGRVMDLEQSKTAFRGLRSARSPGHSALDKYHQKRQASDNCGAKFGGSDGVIISPGYPNSYPNDLSCTMTIVSPHPGSAIELTFGNFHLEAYSRNGECYDSLIATTRQGTNLGIFCGTALPGDLVSTDGELKLILTTDSTVGQEGFIAYYTIRSSTPGCRETLTRSTGVIQSPNYHNNQNNEECEWKVLAPPGRVIQLSFVSFRQRFSSSAGPCEGDRLLIYEANGDTLATICEESPDTIVSETNQITLRFIPNTVRGFLSFRIEYQFF